MPTTIHTPIRKYIRSITAWIGLCGVLTACSSRHTYRQQVQAPLSSLDIPFQSWIIPSDSAAVLTLPTGTVVRIPAGAFVHADGTPVKGAVQFRTREFHDALSIFRSGIPMTTDDSRTSFLKSAGMIELRARSGEQELQVAPGKELEIGLAAYRGADGYSVFYLDKDRKWETAGTFRSDTNHGKKVRLALQAPDEPVESLEDYSVELITNLEENKYLKPFSGVRWKVRKKEVDPATLEAMRMHWDDVKIREIDRNKMKYELIFTATYEDENDKKVTRTARIIARPDLSRKDLSKAKAAFEAEWAQYEMLKKKWEEEQQRAVREADLLNTFRANKVGIWNIDYLMKMNDLITLEVQFDFEKELDPQINKIELFMINEQENYCIRYASNDWKHVRLKPGQPVRLIAVLPGDKVATVSPERLQQALKGNPSKVLLQTDRLPAEALRTAAP